MQWEGSTTAEQSVPSGNASSKDCLMEQHKRHWFADVIKGDTEQYEKALQELLVYLQELQLSKSTFKVEVYVAKRNPIRDREVP